MPFSQLVVPRLVVFYQFLNSTSRTFSFFLFHFIEIKRDSLFSLSLSRIYRTIIYRPVSFLDSSRACILFCIVEEIFSQMQRLTISDIRHHGSKEMERRGWYLGGMKDRTWTRVVCVKSNIDGLLEISNNISGAPRRSTRKLGPRRARAHLRTRTSLMIV